MSFLPWRRARPTIAFLGAKGTTRPGVSRSGRRFLTGMKRSVFWYLAACPDLVRAFFLEPTVEEGRRLYGPAPLLQMMRKRGAKHPARPRRARERLRFA